MTQEYYAYLFGLTGNKIIAYAGATVLYFLVCMRYCCCKLRLIFRKKRELLPPEEAERMVASVWKPEDVPPAECRGSIDLSMDLSIVVPVYNYENVVESCIDSILNQKTAYRYEVIIVDDGSNDATKAILRQYRNNPIVRLIEQENSGISRARNTGINASTGKYLMFVDCDDCIHQDCVETLLKCAYSEETDLVIGAYALVKKQNGVETGRRDIIYSEQNLVGYTSGDVIMNYPGVPWAKVYKRELFSQVRFPEGYWYEDTIIQFLIFRQARTYTYIPKTVYDYMWYEGNYSKVQKRSSERVLDHYWILEKMLKENDRIGLKRDAVLYKVLLNHLGGYLYKAISDLSEDIQSAVFVLGRQLVLENKPDGPYALNFSLREIEKAYLKNDYEKWKLVSGKL